MKYMDKSSLFGNEKDASFNGSIGAIYQSFDGGRCVSDIGGKSSKPIVFCNKES